MLHYCLISLFHGQLRNDDICLKIVERSRLLDSLETRVCKSMPRKKTRKKNQDSDVFSKSTRNKFQYETGAEALPRVMA